MVMLLYLLLFCYPFFIWIVAFVHFCSQLTIFFPFMYISYCGYE